jgi:hypothetical protein
MRMEDGSTTKPGAPGEPRHPVCMEGRPDLAECARQAAGDGRRQCRTPPVPLPRGVSCAARGGEVEKLIRFAEKLPDMRLAIGRAHDARPARPAAGVRCGHPPDQSRVVPRRFRTPHETFTHIRGDNSAQVARERPGDAGDLSLPGEGQGPGTNGDRRRRARGVDPRAARHTRQSAVQVRGRRRVA